MRKDTEQRLAAIERRLHPLARTIQEIIIRGGLPGSDDPTFARAGEMRWQRTPDESFAVFRARAMTEASAAGERFIIIGGLPNLSEAD